MTTSVKVKMLPHVDWMMKSEGGVHTVIRKWFKYLPDYGIDLVAADATSYDIMAVHAGASIRVGDGSPVVSHLHGVYFGDERPLERYEHSANGRIVKVMQHSKAVTVPSEWVAETIAREARIAPHVIQHGIDHKEWEHDGQHDGYVLGYAKNRVGDVCDPAMAQRLANHVPDQRFLMTFGWDKFMSPNIKRIGQIPYSEMIQVVKRAAVYVSPIKETWGLGPAEALAAGVPVLTVDSGNVPSFVHHGYNGYCYDPYDLDDMIAGLAFCLAHRDVLSKNAVESVRHLTWQNSVEQLADMYREVIKQEEPTVGVVIPVYNKPVEQVARAVKSALNQTHMPELIVVVDDASDIVVDLAGELTPEENSLITWVRHEQNMGVAHARNTGVRALNTKYICCLDADDHIEPGFLEACIAPMEKNRSIGVTYTKLKFTTPDGKTGISAWPGEWDYNKFLQKKNQVPTCCVYRKLVWERLGGYRQRYAPTGAGAEDAEFFLRAGAYGFSGKLATEAALFNYSFQSGHTAQPGYTEPDWLAWHQAWVTNKNHPMMSHATPKNNLAHNVLQYDRPDISVIIPVGRSHLGYLYDALDSLEAQSYPIWEVIVVLDWVFDHTILNELKTAYPYVRWVSATESKSRGAGAARNIGVSKARGPMILFLDADDYLHPEFMKKTMQAWVQTKRAVYTDYMGKAVVDKEENLAPNLQRSIIKREGNVYTIGHQLPNFNCVKAVSQPPTDGTMPYIWNNVTTLFPKIWHDAIGGFDESLKTWEDIDYWWRMAKSGYCFHRVPEPLMMYRFSTGTRREIGLADKPLMMQRLIDKHDKIEVEDMGCGCKGKDSSPTFQQTAQQQHAVLLRTATANKGDSKMSDENYVLAKYLSTNRGQHAVIGASTKIKYGYRGGQERFLVHKADIEAQPHMFSVVETAKLDQELPKEKKPVLTEPVPAPIVLKMDVTAGAFEISQPTLGQIPAKKAKVLPTYDPSIVAGVGAALVKRLQEAGLGTPDAVIKAGMVGLMQVDRMRSDAATNLLEYASRYVL